MRLCRGGAVIRKIDPRSFRGDDLREAVTIEIGYSTNARIKDGPEQLFTVPAQMSTTVRP